MADLYFTENDATPEAWATVERVAEEWLGDTPWGQLPLPGWDAGPPPGAAPYVPGARAIPLHLPAGRDLAERVIARLSNRSTGEVRHALGSRYAAGMPVEEDLRAELVRWGGR